ncbi:MAG TPA: tetratricopeptide repeat protein [Bacteroidales bacterium]|nr:tetratricopeptide repeat protein [Bacteroidales bacterium]HPJ58277.1 tetratricopeptide repeat protein [Bacteroidales bacterium]HPR11608.1 tetratricopeptide repeat protein [Bacteroidales bacterium]
MEVSINLKKYRAIMPVLFLVTFSVCMAQEDPLVLGKLRLIAAKESPSADSTKLILNQAIAYFSKELEIFPGSSEAYSGRGEARFMSGDHRGAIADCRKAIESDPGNVKALIIQGRSEAELGDYRSALREFDKAININPHHENVNLTYFYRGNAKSDSGNDAAAIIDYTLSLEIVSYAPAYYRRGMAKINLAEKKGACEDWNLAKKLGMAEAEEMINKHCTQSAIPEPFR